MEIIQALLIQCNSNQPEIRSQAEQTLLRMRNENKNLFLQMISLFLSNNDHSLKSSKALALILAHQTIPFSTSNLLNEFSIEIIKNLMIISSIFFQSEDCSLRSSAATLFSKIMINDHLSGNELQTLQFFNQLLTNPSSPLIIHPLYIIISDFCLYSDMESSFILSILNSLSFFFNIRSPEIDLYCLKIILKLIPSMAEIISTELDKLFTLLLHYCKPLPTRAKSFECISALITNFYPFISKFIPILSSKEFLYLVFESGNLISDEKILNSYLLIWKSISKIEKFIDNDVQNLGLIEKVLFDLLPIILKIASSLQSEISDPDSNDPSVNANKVLNNICSMFIIESKPLFQSYIIQFHKSESFGEREASLSCVFFLLRYLHNETTNEEINNYFGLIMNGLNDKIPRVRQNAIYCAECFCDEFGCENPFSIELMKNIVLKISNDEYAAEDAVSVVGNFFSYQNFPFFDESLISLISFSTSPNLKYATTAFDSLYQFVKFAKPPNQHKLLDILLHNLENCTAFSEFHLYKIIDILTALIFKLKGQLDGKFENIWKILSNGVTKLPFQFVIPISEMSRSCPTKFSPFIPFTLSLIINVLNTENFQLACTGFKILIKSTDLSQFSPVIISILDSLMKLLLNNEISAANKRMAIEVFDSINTEIHPLFESIITTVLPTIASLSIQLDDWGDFDTNFSYLRFFTGIITCSQIQPEFKVIACKSTFHIMSLVINCPKMDSDYVDFVVDSLFSINQLFPDLLKEFAQQHKAIEMTLRHCLECAEEEEYLEKIDIVINSIFA